MPLPHEFTIPYGKDVSWHMRFSTLAIVLIDQSNAVSLKILARDIWPSSSLELSFDALVEKVLGQSDSQVFTFDERSRDAFVEAIRLMTLSAWDAEILIPDCVKLSFSHDEMVDVTCLGEVPDSLRDFFEEWMGR